MGWNSNLGTKPICHGDEGAEPEGSALNFPLNLSPGSQLWS